MPFRDLEQVCSLRPVGLATCFEQVCVRSRTILRSKITRRLMLAVGRLERLHEGCKQLLSLLRAFQQMVLMPTVRGNFRARTCSTAAAARTWPLVWGELLDAVLTV